MSKIYLVINAGVCDYEEYHNVYAFSTKEKAERAFDTMLKSCKADDEYNNYDKTEQSDGYYESYKDGEWSCDHDVLEIKEVELDNETLL